VVPDASAAPTRRGRNAVRGRRPSRPRKSKAVRQSGRGRSCLAQPEHLKGQLYPRLSNRNATQNRGACRTLATAPAKPIPIRRSNDGSGTAVDDSEKRLKPYSIGAK
jgi:hypothetical protein